MLLGGHAQYSSRHRHKKKKTLWDVTCRSPQNWNCTGGRRNRHLPKRSSLKASTSGVERKILGVAKRRSALQEGENKPKRFTSETNRAKGVKGDKQNSDCQQRKKKSDSRKTNTPRPACRYSKGVPLCSNGPPEQQQETSLHPLFDLNGNNAAQPIKGRPDQNCQRKARTGNTKD